MNTASFFSYRRGVSQRTGSHVASALRCLLLGILLVLLPASVPMAYSAAYSGTRMPGAASLSGLQFPAGSTHVFLAERMWLHGMPAQVLVFDVPMGVRDLARSLSEQQPALADLNVLPEQILLSGSVGNEQWVAQMESVGTARTVGRISSLVAGSPRSTPAPVWLPEDGRLRLDMVVMDAGATVSERIWQHPLPAAQMTPLLEARLLRDGWLRQSATDAGQVWGKGSQRVQVSVTPLDVGSALTVRGWML